MDRYFTELTQNVDEIKDSLRATEERIAGMVKDTLDELRARDAERSMLIQAIRADFQLMRFDNVRFRRLVGYTAIVAFLILEVLFVMLLFK